MLAKREEDMNTPRAIPPLAWTFVKDHTKEAVRLYFEPIERIHMLTKSNKSWVSFGWTFVGTVGSIVWLCFASQRSSERFVLLTGLSLASFAVGCLVAFLFTSYGEEIGTVGKIRDLLIGAATGLTLAKAAAIKNLIMIFALGSETAELAVVISCSIVYSVLGFFVMFFQRELILNVVLAESRAERGRLEGTGQAGQVIQSLLLALPASLLSGVDDVDDIIQFRNRDAERLRELLYSSDVQKFLDQAERALLSTTGLDWDVVSKAAHLNYYRTYFEKEEEKTAQSERAHAWIVRALAMNPLHIDLTVKLADTLGMLNRYTEAVAILQKLECTPEAPAYIKQWLGYFLLFVDRTDDAIRYSEEYHRMFPDESDSMFNIAAAYAQKYSDELRDRDMKQNSNSANRKQALAHLKRALQEQPDYADTVKNKWTQKGDSFADFVHDGEFRDIVGLPQEGCTTSSDR